MVIWKYDLENSGNRISMPEGAVILSVANQRDVAVLWALVDPQRSRVLRRIELFGTVYEVESGGTFIGTIMFLGGALVLHAFDYGRV